MAADSSEDRAERLRQAADDAARVVRNLYLTFLLFGTYIAVTIGATTDAQLLKVSPVTLPLLDIGLPIVGFYAIVPWLFVLAHFNLLLQLYLLARRLHAFDAVLIDLDETARAEQLVRLFPFPFSQMLVDSHHARLARSLFTLVVWLTVLLLPLVLLLWAQVRFLPYHDITVTWIQRGALITDVLMLWVFWPLIVTPNADARLVGASWLVPSPVGAGLLDDYSDHRSI